MKKIALKLKCDCRDLIYGWGQVDGYIAVSEAPLLNSGTNCIFIAINAIEEL